MRTTLLLVVTALMLAGSVTACGGSDASTTLDAAQLEELDIRAIEQIEVKWHEASSTKNVDLMMSLWADDATLTIGPETLTGTSEIRNFFVEKAAPFQPENNWVSDTPVYKVRTTVSGNKGTLYFECHYVDVETNEVVNVVSADQDVEKINGTWLITNLAAATPVLSP